jgi:transcriptional repressor of cell division inhibition gene dicB
VTKSEVIEKYGTLTEAARQLGLTKGAVSQWDEKLPFRIQCMIQVRTNGELQVDKDLLEAKAV